MRNSDIEFRDLLRFKATKTWKQDRSKKIKIGDSDNNKTRLPLHIFTGATSHHAFKNKTIRNTINSLSSPQFHLTNALPTDRPPKEPRG